MRICKRMGCCFLGCLPFRRIHPSPGHRSAGRTGWCPHHSSCGPLSTPPPPLHTCNHVLGSRSKCLYPANLSLAASRHAAACLVGWLVSQRASRHSMSYHRARPGAIVHQRFCKLHSPALASNALVARRAALRVAFTAVQVVWDALQQSGSARSEHR